MEMIAGVVCGLVKGLTPNGGGGGVGDSKAKDEEISRLKSQLKQQSTDFGPKTPPTGEKGAITTQPGGTGAVTTQPAPGFGTPPAPPKT